ncbi:MAG TPA: hypothetical protein DDZ84_08250, partial [Firmicutes bacterium]|nr:hypothetical protein [Bacillota bacterium]
IDAGEGLAVIRMGEPLPDDGAHAANRGGQGDQGCVMLEISAKPFASLLWVGAILLLAGTAVAVVRRAQEGRKV